MAASATLCGFANPFVLLSCDFDKSDFEINARGLSCGTCTRNLSGEKCYPASR